MKLGSMKTIREPAVMHPGTCRIGQQLSVAVQGLQGEARQAWCAGACCSGC